jgi:hypothetical protein
VFKGARKVVLNISRWTVGAGVSPCPGKCETHGGFHIR